MDSLFFGGRRIPWAEPIGRFATTSSAHHGDAKDSVETVDSVKVDDPLIEQMYEIGDEADGAPMPTETVPMLISG